MVYAVHILSRHGFLFGFAISLPLLIFFYFGHIKLAPSWVHPRILSEAELIGIGGVADGYNRRLYLSGGVHSNYLAENDFPNWGNVSKHSLLSAFVEKGLRFKPIVFNPSIDVLVILHIQKTGGSSFGRLLALEIVNLTCNRLESGRKQHDCSVILDKSGSTFSHETTENSIATPNKRAIWMFSRFSVGWACGLHADWTELKACVEKVLNARESFNRTRRYHYITMLREPVSRYVSEWRHIARGATWAGAELRCNGRQASLAEVPFCYEGNNWRGVSLSEFLNCEHNLANNRQTRMLADLTKVNCYNRTAMNPEMRAEILFRSALDNLASFSFFGLSEHQQLTQWLFEHTFTNLRFRVNLTQKETKADRFLPTLTALEVHQVRHINSLDVALYDYAKSLFFERIASLHKRVGGSTGIRSSSSLEFDDYNDSEEY